MAADGQASSRRKPIVTPVPITVPVLTPGSGQEQSAPAAKPTLAALGIDLASLDWQRSGTGPGSFEIAFVAGRRHAAHTRQAQPGQSDQETAPPNAGERADWVLLRVAGDPAERVLVYDRNEWMCFLDGAGHGEFDWPERLTRAWAR
jgi:hypothetical protein